MSRPIGVEEVTVAAKQLHQEIEVMFRCVYGPQRAFIFDMPWLDDGERGVYQVMGFAAESEHPGEEERVGLGLISCMRHEFIDLWKRGARTVAWRRDLELSVLSGGERVPNLVRISARVCALNADGARVPVRYEWADGCPAIILTREQVQDGRP